MMAASPKASQHESMAELAAFFAQIAERQRHAEDLEARITAGEECLHAIDQQYQAKVDDLHAIEAVITERQAELADLNSKTPKARVAFEEDMLPLRREKADIHEEIRRGQDLLRTIREQTSDAKQELDGIKGLIAGARNMAGGRTFTPAPAPSLSGPAIISPNTLADYDPLEPEQEASA
jgi:predicted  nucleic acid-binding Zn-ribbon protein